MSRKSLLALAMSLAAIGAIAAVVSCGDGGSSPSDVGTDVPRDDGDTSPDDGAPPGVEPNWDDGVTADFVIDTMRIGRINLGEGFNLDNIHTGPGQHLPEDGPDGVDNQLGALIQDLQEAGLEFSADESIAEGIADGSLLIILRHMDVDSWTRDPGLVRLLGYSGKDADADPLNNLTGDGELLVDARSLTPPGTTDLMSSLIRFDNGVLEDTPEADLVWQEGDFEAGPSVFNVDIPVEEEILRLSVNGTRVVWDLDTAPTGTPPVDGKVINGLLGGYVFLGDAARAISQIDLSGTTITANTIRTILSGQADMDVIPPGPTTNSCDPATVMDDCAPGQSCEPNPAPDGPTFCYEQPDNPDAISLGIVFTAVSCRITGIWTDPSP